MTRRFQFSLGALVWVIGVFAVALWFVRTALDSAGIEIVAASVLLLPIILGAAVGKLFGGAAAGDVSVAQSYCLLAALAWLLAILAIAMETVGKMTPQLAQWIV
ncbi:MAG TPA: hypothetical protein VHC22_27765 [Pirellulales bacterium]|nr:hypothetical protein [Pirellulales bacterium]